MTTVCVTYWYTCTLIAWINSDNSEMLI